MERLWTKSNFFHVNVEKALWFFWVFILIILMLHYKFKSYFDLYLNSKILPDTLNCQEYAMRKNQHIKYHKH